MIKAEEIPVEHLALQDALRPLQDDSLVTIDEGVVVKEPQVNNREEKYQE